MPNPYEKMFAVAICGVGMVAGTAVVAQTSPAAQQSAEKALPAIANVRADAVILRASPAATTVQALPVRRRLNQATLRAQPSIPLGKHTLNFKPMFDNPASPINVAQRLRGIPNAAEVLVDDTQILEIDQGIVVRSLLTYRAKLGTCSDAGRRRQFESAGGSCVTRRSDAQIAAAFANPRDDRYIPETSRRARAISDSKAKVAREQADLATDVAEFRAALASPGRQDPSVRAIPAGEAARLAALSDAQLSEELVNSGDTTIEQVLFIPKRDQPFTPLLQSAGGAPEKPGGLGTAVAAKDVQLLHGTAIKGVIAGEVAATAAASNRTLQSHVFLTGFTLAKNYEWRERISKCYGYKCRKTAHVELYAGFGYGIGLRFPMRVGGEYQYSGPGQARLIPSFAPINGNAGDYAASGLPTPKLFGGKELVAEFNSYAGANWNLPILGSSSVNFNASKDFTQELPAPFTGGNFQPPVPGGSGLPVFTKVFEGLDLIGGRASFNRFGGKVFPAIKVNLVSDSLKFTLKDKVTNQTSILTQSGQPVTLGVRPLDQSSNFTISDPVYNVAFEVTPGISARLFVDVAIWSQNWDWPVWFPQLSVQLPPNGLDFACHAQTTCTREYQFMQRSVRPGEGRGSAVQ